MPRTVANLRSAYLGDDPEGADEYDQNFKFLLVENFGTTNVTDEQRIEVAQQMLDYKAGADARLALARAAV